MSSDRKLVVALLGVVVVLLSLSLGRAMGQAQPAPPWLPPVDDSPRLVGLSVFGKKIIRLWSDGVVEERQAVTTGPCCPNLHWHHTYPEWFEVVPQ